MISCVQLIFVSRKKDVPATFTHSHIVLKVLDIGGSAVTPSFGGDPEVCVCESVRMCLCVSVRVCIYVHLSIIWV